jgi:hypothetical protein
MLEVFFALKASADEQGIIVTPTDFWKIAKARNGYAFLASDDNEIERAIQGLFDGASTSTNTTGTSSPAERKVRRKQLENTPEQIEEWRQNALRFVEEAGGDVSVMDVMEASPIRPADGKGFITACESLFKPDEGVAVVTKINAEGIPWGGDEVRTPAEWRKHLASGKVIRCKAGGWWRCNPITPSGGTGKYGTAKDCDIVAHRYCLLENDKLPIGLQLSLLARLALPIVSIVDSANKSYHAFCRLDCPDKPTFHERATLLLQDLHNRFGFDLVNTNPSRMSRLPDGWRDIKRREGSDGRQAVLYLCDLKTEAKGILQ